MEELAERLRSADAAERVGAAREIRRLTRASADHRRALSCAVVPLVELLCCASGRVSDGEEEEEEEASAVMLALLNLAVKDEKNKIAIVEAGSLNPITHYLQSTNQNLQEHAAALLLTLSASTHNKPSITASKPVHLLFQILQSGTKQAKTDSLMCIYNLSTLPQNLHSLLEHEYSVQVLLTLIRSCRRKSSKIVEKSCALLESLVAFDQGRSALVDEIGGVLSVVEVVEEGSILGKEHAVGALLTICESNREKYREIILNEGVIPGLLELTVHGTPKSRSKARRLLEMLRNSQPHDRPRMEADTIENIVSDVVSQMDGQDCADKARRMVAEMVRVSMERSLRHLKQRAFYV